MRHNQLLQQVLPPQHAGTPTGVLAWGGTARTPAITGAQEPEAQLQGSDKAQHLYGQLGVCSPFPCHPHLEALHAARMH